jgi:hypothetical protein
MSSRTYFRELAKTGIAERQAWSGICVSRAPFGAEAEMICRELRIFLATDIAAKCESHSRLEK